MQKITQMLRNIFSYLKIIHILHPRFHPKIIGHILRNKLRITKVPLFKIIMKMKIKIKNRSHRYNIDRPRSRHGHKYSKNKVS